MATTIFNKPIDTEVNDLAAGKMDKPTNAGTADQVLRNDGNGGSEWGDNPSSLEIETAVNTYLDRVITNPESPPLDRTLTSGVSAAPADMVGDLKSAFIPYKDNFDTVNEISANTNLFSIITAGDYKATSAVAATLTNCPVSNGFRMICITRNSSFLTRILFPHDDAIYISRYYNGSNYNGWIKYQNYDVAISAINDSLKEEANWYNIDWHNGYYRGDNYTYEGKNSNVWQTSNFLPCKPGGIITVCGPSSQSNRCVIAYFDAEKKIIGKATSLGTDLIEVTTTVPNGAVYYRCLRKYSDLSKTYYRYNGNAEQNHLAVIMEKALDTVCYVSSSNGADSTDNDGTIGKPFATISYAIQKGARRICAKPGVYNEKVEINGGDIEIIPWIDDQSYSTNAQCRPKIELIYGTEITPSASGTAGIYQASYTADSDSNIYKVFVSHTVDPTTEGSISLEYNAMLIGDNTGSAYADMNIKQRLFTPVLTEGELSAEGTFYYSPGTIKFHPWGGALDTKYYIPNDGADNGLKLQNMKKVHLENLRIIGVYTNAAYLIKCDNVTIEACDFGLSGKGNGLQLDNTNAQITDCHAFGCSADGFNMHEYGHSDVNDCTAFYCGDDGISQHQGCTGTVDGGEWAYCKSGGVTPAFGAKIDAKNIYAHHNGAGLQFFGSNDYAERNVTAIGCVCVNNTKDIYADRKYIIVLANSAYGTKEIGSSATLTEIGNTIVN